MTSIKCLNELPDRVIEAIVEFLDLLDLTEVLQIGNRLLSLKLGTAFTHYSYNDTGRYGLSVCAHQWLLPQLVGLKRVCISTFPSSTKLSELIVEILPKTVTSIDLGGGHSLKAWMKGADQIPTNFGERFPSLNSLSLRRDNSYCVSMWLESHLPSFPPTLTHLCLEHIFKTPFDDTQFPASLEYLEIVLEELPDFSWIFTLPRLHTLKLDLVSSCDYEDGEELGECAGMQHSALTTLHLIVYKDEVDENFAGYGVHFNFQDFLSTLRSTLKTLFRALPALKELSTGRVGEIWNDDMTYSAPSNLRILSCPIISGTTYPNHLEELSWGYHFEKPSEEVLGEINSVDVARLPPSLLVLHGSYLMLGTDVQGSLFPRNITSLTVFGIHPEMIDSLPPRLTRLSTLVELVPYMELFNKINSALPLLSVMSTEQHDFCKIATSKLSIYGSGWTCLTHATFSEDVDSLESLVEHWKREGERGLWTAVFKVIDELRHVYHIDDLCKLPEQQILRLPLRSLEWFRMRGLCSSPRRRRGRVDSPCLAGGMELSTLDTLSFIQWAHPHLDKSAWKSGSVLILPKLCRDSKVPALEFLFSNGYDLTNQGILTRAIMKGQIKTVEWLLNHGHFNINISSILGPEYHLRGKLRPDADKIAQIVKLLREKKVSYKHIRGTVTSTPGGIFSFFMSGKVDPTFSGFVIWLEWLIDIGLRFTNAQLQLTSFLLIQFPSSLTPTQVENWLAAMKWLNSKNAPMDHRTFSQLQALVSSTPNNAELLTFLQEQTLWKGETGGSCDLA